jgi:hypothetical protein
MKTKTSKKLSLLYFLLLTFTFKLTLSKIQERQLGRFIPGQSIDSDDDYAKKKFNSLSNPFANEEEIIKIKSLRKLRKSDLNQAILEQEIATGAQISKNELESSLLGNIQYNKEEFIYLNDYDALLREEIEESQKQNSITQKSSQINLASESINVVSELKDEQSVKMNEMNNILTGANSGSIQKLNELIQKKNEEVLANQMAAISVINNYFSKLQITSARKRNCIFFQEMMKSMPSQEKRWTKKLKDFFSSRTVTNLKSYRTLAIEMLLSFETTTTKREFINRQIDKYREAKALYYQEFMQDFQADYESENERIREMQNEVASSTQQLDVLLVQQQELESTFDAMRIELKRLADSLSQGKFVKLQKEKLAFVNMAQEVREATEDIDFSKFETHFSTKSTVKLFVKEFIEVTGQAHKWEQMQKALEEHFEVKKSKEYSHLYVVKTNQEDLAFITKKIAYFVTYLNKKAGIKKASLLNHIEEYIATLQEQINQDQEFQEYSTLIIKAKNIKLALNQSKEESQNLTLKIEEIRFRLQKTDFKNNLDYVFPSGLVIGLQTKLKELKNMIEGLSTDTAYLDPGDTEYVIPIQEQEEFKTFFETEDPDLEKTYQRVESQLKVAIEIDEIEGLLDLELGEALGLAQSVSSEKNCFQLAELSYFVFIMLKTNVVVKESKFFEGLFAALKEEATKEFIVFNYMLFTNEDYVDDLLARNEKQELSGVKNDNILNDIFIKDYISNYTLMISFYRDMTEFGRAETGIVQKSKNFAKNLLAMVLTMVQAKMDEFMEGNIEDLVDVVVAVIMTAIPFLVLIPYGKTILNSVITYIIQFVIQILSVFASGVANFFNRKYAEMMNNNLKEQLKSEFKFDYMKKIEQIRAIGVEKKQASFDTNANIKVIEEKYLNIMNDEDNVFNKLESLHVFRDVDYEKNLLEMYKKNY